MQINSITGVCNLTLWLYFQIHHWEWYTSVLLSMNFLTHCLFSCGMVYLSTSIQRHLTMLISAPHLTTQYLGVKCCRHLWVGRVLHKIKHGWSPLRSCDDKLSAHSYIGCQHSELCIVIPISYITCRVIHNFKTTSVDYSHIFIHIYLPTFNKIFYLLIKIFH